MDGLKVNHAKYKFPFSESFFGLEESGIVVWIASTCQIFTWLDLDTYLSRCNLERYLGGCIGVYILNIIWF